MTNAHEAEKRLTRPYQDAYARLTKVLTNMFASERSALDDSVLYSVAMDLVIKGQDVEAVEIAKMFQDERGDAWRVRAYEVGLTSTPNFANEV